VMTHIECALNESCSCNNEMMWSGYSGFNLLSVGLIILISMLLLTLILHGSEIKTVIRSKLKNWLGEKRDG